MASLLEDKLFEISGQGPAPTKDFFQLVITKTLVIWRWWKISLRSEYRKTQPGEMKLPHDYYLHDKTLQHQVKVVFGENTLEYSKALCNGDFDYLPRLPDRLLLRILAFLELEEVQQLRPISRKFKKNMTTRDEDEALILNAVKAGVHSVCFLATSIFAYLIVATVSGVAELRRVPCYVLLCQHCVSIAGFNGVGVVIHLLRALRVPAPRLLCWALFDLQVVLARGLVITLTTMALNTCVSVCLPLRYHEVVHVAKYAVMLVIWGLAAISPVVFTALAFIEAPPGYVTAQDPSCPTALEGFIPRVVSLALLALLVLLIILSYILIYHEGRRAGHFSRSNSRGRRTILIHSLQLSLHILPVIPIISRLRKSLPVTLVNFLVFCVAQSLSPIVYGLRSRDIQARLPDYIPHWLQRTRGGTSDQCDAKHVEDQP
ncbi:hypothetical protein JZ751_013799 [Albula glossodonta]|uniref:F-box domain-containing protein n=1 Tax=Albula glossodonta TaxID=121402 RepID=A0A8T2NTT9_9TELE|nr:hypothetical protein JZ751_013799 [Albula glossodonta]